MQTKTIVREGYIAKSNFNLKETYIDFSKPQAAVCDQYQKVKVSWEVPLYRIKVVSRLKNGVYYLHLVNDIEDNRLPYDRFISLIQNIKAVHDNQLNWNFYPGQPIYEYKTSVFELRKTIEDLYKDIEVIYEQEN